MSLWHKITHSLNSGIGHYLQGHVLGEVGQGLNNLLGVTDSIGQQQSFQEQMLAQQQSWQAQMSNTAYQRQALDMQQAGLNPVQGVGSGGADYGSPNATGGVSASSASSLLSLLNPIISEQRTRNSATAQKDKSEATRIDLENRKTKKGLDHLEKQLDDENISDDRKDKMAREMAGISSGNSGFFGSIFDVLNDAWTTARRVGKENVGEPIGRNVSDYKPSGEMKRNRGKPWLLTETFHELQQASRDYHRRQKVKSEANRRFMIEKGYLKEDKK